MPLTVSPKQLKPAQLPLYCCYTPEPVESLLSSENLLFATTYDDNCLTVHPPHSEDPRSLSTGLVLCDTPAAAQPPLNEAWYCSEAVSSGKEGDVSWSKNDHFLFASIRWREDSAHKFSEKTKLAYSKLLNLVRSKGFDSLIRIWNYLPSINYGSGDTERYRLFSQGRHEAFVNSGYPFTAFPSASALGHHQNTCVVYLIASKYPGRHFENPQQVSAYRYPRQYGPRSPSFARATLLRVGSTQETVFISGTASIVGHKTLHPESCESQLEVTFQNIEKLLSHISEQVHRSMEPDLLKIYVRREEDLEMIKNMVAARMGDNVQTLYLQGDICRRELLVEIEGLCQRPLDLY